jgi:hypothetical protein
VRSQRGDPILSQSEGSKGLGVRKGRIGRVASLMGVGGFMT